MPTVLLLASLLAMTAAYAGPQAEVEVERELLALDTSASMLAEDVRPAASPQPSGRDRLRHSSAGRDGQRFEVPVDEPVLAEIADGTGGQTYTAATADQLQQVYASIRGRLATALEEQDVSARGGRGGPPAAGRSGRLEHPRGLMRSSHLGWFAQPWGIPGPATPQEET